MIPRYQVVLFAVLVVASAIMGGVLWHLRDRAHQRLLDGQDSAPTQAPDVAPVQQATLMVANDATDALETRTLSLPLPLSEGARARAVLGKLMDLYAAPDAVHPVPGGATAISAVFLLPAPANNSGAPAAPPKQDASDAENTPEMAVVNLSGPFAASHPSGIETETLTLQSICETLHANLPNVREVRFLVDGQPQATLAGHADLMRTYLTGDSVPAGGAQP